MDNSSAASPPNSDRQANRKSGSNTEIDGSELEYPIEAVAAVGDTINRGSSSTGRTYKVNELEQVSLDKVSGYKLIVKSIGTFPF
jgi:hypothetical protein